MTKTTEHDKTAVRLTEILKKLNEGEKLDPKELFFHTLFQFILFYFPSNVVVIDSHILSKKSMCNGSFKS